jgi:hypothetical protein
MINTNSSFILPILGDGNVHIFQSVDEFSTIIEATLYFEHFLFVVILRETLPPAEAAIGPGD